MHGGLEGCGTTLSVRQNVTGLHVWDRPNRPNEHVGLADFFSILLEE